MGNCLSGGGPDEEINKEKNRRNRDNKAKTKILFLGAGESGKTTIIKQAILIHGNGFTEPEREEYIKRITTNILGGAKAVWLASSAIGHEITDPSVVKAGEKIAASIIVKEGGKDAENEVLVPDRLSDELVEHLITLMNNKQFQETIKESYKFQLEDTWPTFMQKIQEEYPTWGGPNWKPSDEDILLSRSRTTGVQTIELTLKDQENQKIVLVDVGGQRSERRKWLKLFHGVSGVVFVTSLSEYNQTLFEASDVNRLTESISLFEEYGKRPEFADAALMLFMNKYDLFKEKYWKEKIPLIKPIANCPEPPRVEDEDDETCIKAIEWLFELFAAQVEGKRQKNTLYPHVTTALDRGNIGNALHDCTEFILKRQLIGAGLMSLDEGSLIKF